MGQRTKYGKCAITGVWVPRDSMRCVNVKAFDEDDNEERFRLRLSPVGFEQFTAYLREHAWDGVLIEERELFPDGLSTEQRESRDRALATSEDYAAAPIG